MGLIHVYGIWGFLIFIIIFWIFWIKFFIFSILFIRLCNFQPMIRVYFVLIGIRLFFILTLFNCLFFYRHCQMPNSFFTTANDSTLKVEILLIFNKYSYQLWNMSNQQNSPTVVSVAQFSAWRLVFSVLIEFFV